MKPLYKPMVASKSELRRMSAMGQKAPAKKPTVPAMGMKMPAKGAKPPTMATIYKAKGKKNS